MNKHTQLVVIPWECGVPSLVRITSDKPITGDMIHKAILKKYPYYAEDSENCWYFVNEPTELRVD